MINALDYAVVTILAAVCSLALQEHWSWPTLTTPWFANLALLAIGVPIGQLIVVGFKHLDAHRGALILLLDVVLASLIGALVFKEHISWQTFVGGGFILTAAAVPELLEL